MTPPSDVGRLVNEFQEDVQHLQQLESGAEIAREGLVEKAAMLAQFGITVVIPGVAVSEPFIPEVAPEPVEPVPQEPSTTGAPPAPTPTTDANMGNTSREQAARSGTRTGAIQPDGGPPAGVPSANEPARPGEVRAKITRSGSPDVELPSQAPKGTIEDDHKGKTDRTVDEVRQDAALKAGEQADSDMLQASVINTMTRAQQ